MESCVADKPSVFNSPVTAHMLLPFSVTHDFSLCCMKKRESNPRLSVASHSSKVVVVEQSSGLSVHPAE
jgi:hypothetical protein